jgi:hypothetical protein
MAVKNLLLKRLKKLKKIEKKKFEKNCENSKLVYPRYLGYFYYHGTIILPCIRQQETIRNWVTFCGQSVLKKGRMEAMFDFIVTEMDL